MCGVTGDLVADALGRKDGNIIDDALVCVKVQSKTCVVFFNNGPCGLLDGLGTDTLKIAKK